MFYDDFKVDLCEKVENIVRLSENVFNSLIFL